ncbi:hypothetical protein MKX03_006640 [Papaver bracteatum]|nr:hypothetical protein MKX03_006640 [Papaver bracteatum]
MLLKVTGFINYGQKIVRAARYIGQSFMITLSHTNRLPVTIQHPYEKLITSERFRGRIHFEFDKCIACEVCLIGNWKRCFEKSDCLTRILILESVFFFGNCVEYCPTNCLSMTEEYNLSTYDRHKLNYNQIALGRLPMTVIGDYTIKIIMNSTQIKKATGKLIDLRTITDY